MKQIRMVSSISVGIGGTNDFHGFMFGHSRLCLAAQLREVVALPLRQIRATRSAAEITTFYGEK
jgi:hypothetical protein